jgi:hypothetical protein
VNQARALEYLAGAVEKGFKDWKQMSKDPDLKNARAGQAWIAFQDKYRK